MFGSQQGHVSERGGGNNDEPLLPGGEKERGSMGKKVPSPSPTNKGGRGKKGNFFKKGMEGPLTLPKEGEPVVAIVADKEKEGGEKKK